MNTRWIVLLVAAAATFVMTPPLFAGDCPQCGEGTCYREVITYRCKMAPDNQPIKKTVYECKEVPYCEHKLPKLGHGDCCLKCEACPKFKKVLIKKEIVVGEKCGTKCVPEPVITKIAVPCCRCGHQPVQPQAPVNPEDAGQPSPTAPVVVAD